MNDYLAHYGILGMKWGVRRYRNEDGSLTEKGKKRYYKVGRKKYYDREKARQAVLKSKKPKVVYKNRDLLTDDELRAKLNRMSLENQAYSYAYPKSSARAKAKETFVSELIKGLVKPIAAGIVGLVVAKHGGKAVKSALQSGAVSAGKGTVTRILR